MGYFFPKRGYWQDSRGRQSEAAECIQILHSSTGSRGEKDYHRGRDLLRMNRLIQATGVFAMIKEDMAFRRFLLRGKRNVSTKWHLISIAYNIQKLHHKKTNRPVGNTLDYTKGGLTTPHSKKAHFFGRNLKIIPEFWG